jgi:hypothetical protein
VVAAVRRGSDPVPLVLSAVQVAVFVWLWLGGRLTLRLALVVLVAGLACSFLAGVAEEVWAFLRRGSAAGTPGGRPS